MLKANKTVNSILRRGIKEAAANNVSSRCTPTYAISEEGYKLASIDVPSQVHMGCSRFALIFNAGSRHELTNQDRGLTHLLRRSFGLSTVDTSAVNLTRHFQQMGARVNCSTTRDHVIYTVDVSPNLVERAGVLVAEMATNTVFYEWELRRTVNKLLHKDVDLLNRRELGALAQELLHEAAYGQHGSNGTGLGRSLYTTADRIGSYSLGQIESFLNSLYTPSNCTLALVGAPERGDGLSVLRQIKSAVNARPGGAQQQTSAGKQQHGFVGGDIRRELASASYCVAQLAWPVTADRGLIELACSALNGSSGRIAHAGGSALLPPSCVAFAKGPYQGGHAMLGLAVAAKSGGEVGDRLTKALAVLRSLSVSSPEQFKQAQQLAKADLLMAEEDSASVVLDLGLQAAAASEGQSMTFTSSADRVAAMAKMTSAQLTEMIKKTSSQSVAALSVVGCQAGDVPPLSVLLS